MTFIEYQQLLYFLTVMTIRQLKPFLSLRHVQSRHQRLYGGYSRLDGYAKSKHLSNFGVLQISLMTFTAN